ncbi:hypothetical protein HMPREF1554_02099 [Porphyromonas gingivalis F0569]|nr:hypothetical protein HMPREF1554_02099 [Porphyromonas gingivalis F0569]
MLLHIIIVRKCRTRIVRRVDVDALDLACVARGNERTEGEEVVAVNEEVACIRVSVAIFGVLYQDAWLEDILFALADPREFESLLHIVSSMLFQIIHSLLNTPVLFPRLENNFSKVGKKIFQGWKINFPMEEKYSTLI